MVENDINFRVQSGQAYHQSNTKTCASGTGEGMPVTSAANEKRPPPWRYASVSVIGDGIS